MVPFASFQGIYTALVTPFVDGKIDFASLKNLIERQCASGVHGLVLAEITGENPTLSDEERKELLSFVVETVGGRLQLLMTVDANDTRRALEQITAYETLGADGFLAVTPFYNQPTQAGLYLHFEALAKATDKPICLYSSPFRCGVEIAPETVRRLRENHKNIVAIQENGSSCNRVAQLVKENDADFRVLTGEDVMMLPFFSLGAKGLVSVAANLIPEEIVRLYRFVSDNNFEAAADLHRRYYALFRALTIETNPVPIKYLLQRRGLIKSAEVRLPLCLLSEKNAAVMEKVLDGLNGKI